MALQRRDFLKRGVGLVAASMVVPAFLAASAVGTPACKGGDDDTTMTTDGSATMATTAATEPTGTPTGTVTRPQRDLRYWTRSAFCVSVSARPWKES